ncbi:hybrid sensor histidine kinase/response regulator [Pseudanabaena sp. FACHB-2040]|uniref:hybrid sensor histidine kinase/response regulator n=1 Tax=Pseudanabaena sp. FACHB-2040 TaxID=2692859 RepID=UPI0016896E7B|nr:hybrid sensor histidine kinase/response regulator [Pseudanabaena sp. FACHB-2040]MBD2255972.1 response regulator [Pseudanabaena sp. FACHB-2040]
MRLSKAKPSLPKGTEPPQNIRPGAVSFSDRTLSLKWHLVLLIAGALLPVALFSVVIVHRLSSQEQEASERRALLAARNLAESVDREVTSTVGTLLALAESEQLDQGDLQSFYTEAQRVALTQPTWLSVLLSTPQGNQVVNSRQPFGTPLPPVREVVSLRRVVQNPRPTVGDLVLGHSGTWAFPVRVPVIRDGELRYVLTAAITPQSLAEVVRRQTAINEEWTRTVVDSQGVVVARTRDPERFIGQQGTPSFLKQINAASEGVYRDTTLEGVQVYVAFSRTRDFRWTAAVTVPVDTIEGPARRAMGLVIGTGLVLLFLSTAGAIALSWRISRAIASATAAAEALAKGQPPNLKPTSIAEVAQLGAALDYSASLLLQREQERDQHLALAEAARAEAETASRLKDEFLITVSHELRTPLNAILGWAALLQAGQLDEAKARRALETIERNAKTQAQLVNDLLDTSRIISGKLHLETQAVDLAAVVAIAIDSVRHSANAKAIELSFQNDTNPGPVLGDQNRLQQVVWNLLSNAIKFTPTGGRVEVELSGVNGPLSAEEDQKHFAQLTIKDTGIGIKPEFLPYVFDRFRQADGSTTRSFGGLGLGLAIVRHLIEIHGGTVRADSDGEGQGATFTLKLPLAPTYLEDGPLLRRSTLPIETGEAHALAGVRVLVVDDEPDACDFVAAVLQHQGATVQTCTSAAAAFSQVTAWQPNVILSDIGMPHQDGYAFIRQVRQWEGEAGGKIPAAALTALTRDEDALNAIASGFQIHIAKPVQPTKLIAVVTELLGLK